MVQEVEWGIMAAIREAADGGVGAVRAGVRRRGMRVRGERGRCILVVW